jgi:hypothetical protein
MYSSTATQDSTEGKKHLVHHALPTHSLLGEAGHSWAEC